MIQKKYTKIMRNDERVVRGNDWTKSEINPDDDHPIPKHKHWILGEGTVRCFLVGASGVGKTRALTSIIPNMSGETTHVIVCSCIERNAAHDEIERWCEKKGINYSKATTATRAEKDINLALNEKELKDHVVIVFDDFSLMNRVYSGNDPYTTLICKTCSWRRNDNCSVVCITQHYSNLPVKTRVSINLRLIFRTESAFAHRLIEGDVQPVFDQADLSFQDVYRRLIRPFPFNYIIVGSHPVRIAVMDFSKEKCGEIRILYDPSRMSGSGVVRGVEEKNKMKEELEKGVVGEIDAGNNSEETALMGVALEITKEKNARRRNRLIKKFVEMVEDGDIDDGVVGKIYKQFSLDEYIDFS